MASTVVVTCDACKQQIAEPLASNRSRMTFTHEGEVAQSFDLCAGCRQKVEAVVAPAAPEAPQA